MQSILDEAITDTTGTVWLQSEDDALPEIGLIGCDVYTGMAGMAFIFAGSFRLSRRPTERIIAVDCMSYALDHADDILPDHRRGFYNGWAGLIYMAVYVGEVTENAILLSRADALLDRLIAEPVSEEMDLMTGAAGTVLGMALVQLSLGAKALSAARTAADIILDGARTMSQEDAIAWNTIGELPLTGLSHGNAGIILALCELYALTREDRLREAAKRALGYERAYFDAEAGNWLDLRHHSSAASLEWIPPSAEVAWCHGAGGIALSRLRAYEVTGDPEYLADLRIAARTLYQNVAETEFEGAWPSCLCHGLIGNLEILLTLRQRMGAVPFTLSERELHAEGLNHWDTSIIRMAEDPSLMLGMGGIAHYLMRRQDPSVPSILLPRRIGEAVG